MKYMTLLILLALLYVLPLSAQQLSLEFDQVSKNDFDYASVPFDPEADAVIMFDIGESSFVFDNGSTIRYVRQKRIKILSDAGVSWADMVIPFYQDGYGKTEYVRNIEAQTINFTDGQIQRIPVDPGQIYEAQWRNNWKVKKLAFSQVQKGSILDLRYEIESPFLQNLQDWEFQNALPTLYSKYIVKMVPFYEYVFLLQGANAFDFHSSGEAPGKRQTGGVEYRDMVHTFGMKNVPAFRDEGFTTSRNDHILKIDFQIAAVNNLSSGTRQEVLSTWPKVIDDLLSHENFGKYLNKAERQSSDILARVSLTSADPVEQAKTLISYLRQNFSVTGTRLLAGHSPKEVIEARSGSSAELNLLLCGTLRAAGIPAEPVIISTREHGKVRTDYPFVSFFNNVVVLAGPPEHRILTDATSAYIPFNRIPEHCINDAGLVVNKDEVLWLDLSAQVISESNYTLTLDYNPASDHLDVAGALKYTEYDAAARRASYRDSAAVQAMLDRVDIQAVTEIRLADHGDPDKPFGIRFKGIADAQHIGDQIAIHPFLSFPPSENPFKWEDRTYPVDFVYRQGMSFTSIIGIPSGYDVESIPENYTLNDELIHFDRQVQQLGDKLKVTANVTFKKAVYPVSDYKRLKRHYDMIVSKLGELVVLKPS